MNGRVPKESSLEVVTPGSSLLVTGMYVRICSFIALLLAALALSECASHPCPPGYHLGPYGRRCWPDWGSYYPPPPGYGPPPEYAAAPGNPPTQPPPAQPPPTGYRPTVASPAG